jgi:hypothetical protein
VTGLPPDNLIHRAVLFEMPPSLSKEQAVVASVEPENQMTMTFMKLTIVRGAASLLDTTFGDQATSGGTATILHRKQQQYIIDRMQQQQDTSE